MIDTTNDKVTDTKDIGEAFSGNITYDEMTGTIYFVAGTNDLYGIKVSADGKLKDMTQDELSKQSGIYLSTIKKYESGERNPKPDQLQKIAEALGISVTVFLDYDINTVSDVLSLVMKLNEQSPLKISADKDKDGNYIPSSIHMTFEDSQINEAICSYLNCKQQIDLIAYEDNDKAVIEQQKEFYDDKINRLLLFNECIKKIR